MWTVVGTKIVTIYKTHNYDLNSFHEPFSHVFFNELFTNLPSQKLHSNVDLADFSGSKLDFDFSFDFSLVMYLDKKA